MVFLHLSMNPVGVGVSHSYIIKKRSCKVTLTMLAIKLVYDRSALLPLEWGEFVKVQDLPLLPPWGASLALLLLLHLFFCIFQQPIYLIRSQPDATIYCSTHLKKLQSIFIVGLIAGVIHSVGISFCVCHFITMGPISVTAEITAAVTQNYNV